MSEDEGRMKSHCCYCVSGILCTFLGIALFSTGLSMILDYGMFDLATLPEGWQNSDGQRNLGIILTVAATVSLIIGVLVSVLFFTVCNKSSGECTERGITNNPKKEQPPSLPKIPVIPVIKTPESLEPQYNRPTTGVRSHSKHHRKHSKRSRHKRSKHSSSRLPTHHEAQEEPDSMHPRESRTKHQAILFYHTHHILNPDFQENDSGSYDHNISCSDITEDLTDRDSEINSSANYPQPMKIAPADEQFSSCDSGGPEVLTLSHYEEYSKRTPDKFWYETQNLSRNKKIVLHSSAFNDKDSLSVETPDSVLSEASANIFNVATDYGLPLKRLNESRDTPDSLSTDLDYTNRRESDTSRTTPDMGSIDVEQQDILEIQNGGREGRERYDFRVVPGSISSQESSSFTTTSEHRDIQQPNPTQVSDMQQFDRQLSDILK